MYLTSLDFQNGGMMPVELTCDGRNVSPELVITEVPEGAKSLALIMDDPDAPGGTFVHWVVWNIPPETKKIERGTEPKGVQGKSSFGRKGYGGPCPPSGTHRYYFKLYALDQEIRLHEGASKKELEKEMEGHIVGRAELMGKYSRK